MSPWYVSEKKAEHSARIEAAPEALRQHVRELVENGYTVVRGAVSPETLTSAKAAYSAFKERAKAFNPPTVDGRHRRLVNLHCAVPELVDLFSKNRAALVLDYLFGEDASLYTSLFYEIGSSQDLHRDTPYFWTNPGYSYFGFWVALEDVDQQNGCLQVVPKSHLLPEEDREDIALQFYANCKDVPNADDRLWMEYQTRAQRTAKSAELSTVDVCVGPGDTIIWHPHLLHGGRVISDPSRTRLSLVMHTTPVNQAVFHHEGFFNPESTLAERYEKPHLTRGDRMYVSYDAVSFGHAVELPVSKLSK